jgi:ribose/xylose/arabinose/galactoside ABC-type transport system permease subunit
MAALIAAAVGALVGLFNGAVIHFVKLPPFIVTFSTYGTSRASGAGTRPRSLHDLVLE